MKQSMSDNIEKRNRTVLCPTGWTWKKLESIDKFWVGVDACGSKWLLKNRGSFYASREMIFSLIAEDLGINVQKSKYLLFSDDIFIPAGASKYELAIQYIEKYDGKDDSRFASFKYAYESKNSLELLMDCDHQDSLDKVKVDMLSYIFGANETSEILPSKDGRIYIIDNEQMFSGSPSDLFGCPWFRDDNDIALKIAVNLCRDVYRILDSELECILAIPGEYVVQEKWSIKDILIEARNYIEGFLRNCA